MLEILPISSEAKLSRVPWSTLSFMAACVLMFIITYETAWFYPGFFAAHIEGLAYTYPYPLSALTCIFLHSGFWHIFGNLLWFFVFAAPLEMVLTRRRFWVLLVISAVVASYFHTLMTWLAFSFAALFHPALGSSLQAAIQIPCIGASGMVSAFAAAYLVRFWRKKIKVAVLIMGMPLPKMFWISSWILVLLWFMSWEIFMGAVYFLTTQSDNIAHFAHLGGFLCGLGFSFAWGFHRGHRRDYYWEAADNLYYCPIPSTRLAFQAYTKALRHDPDNPEILLAVARTATRLRLQRTAVHHYQKAVLASIRSGNDAEALEIYVEAFRKHELLFNSGFQIELARRLLEAGHWQIAEQALRAFCAKLGQAVPLEIYLQGRLALASVCESHAGRSGETRSIIKDMLEKFPDHPLLAYPRQRLLSAGEKGELFCFDRTRIGYPFTLALAPTAVRA
jgi:membrane associated rhomboid family serine protease